MAGTSLQERICADISSSKLLELALKLMQAQIAQCWTDFGIDSFADRDMRTLSTGEARRALIARARKAATIRAPSAMSGKISKARELRRAVDGPRRARRSSGCHGSHAWRP